METDDVSDLLLKWSSYRRSDYLNAKHLEASTIVAVIMAERERFAQLSEFISGLTCEEFAILRGEERFLKSLVALYFHERRYSETVMLLKNGTFQNAENLVEVWNNCQYKLQEFRTGKIHTPQSRFRTRKRFPPPPSFHLNTAGLKLRHYRASANRQQPIANQKLPSNQQSLNSVDESVTNVNFILDAVTDQQISKQKKKKVQSKNQVNSVEITTKQSTNEIACYNNNKIELGRVNFINSEISTTICNALPNNVGIYSKRNLASEEVVPNMPQEKVTLHYFSTDVKNSWNPHRIKFLLDICRDEKASIGSGEAAVAQPPRPNVHQILVSQFLSMTDDQFPPNVSIIPETRTQL